MCLFVQSIMQKTEHTHTKAFTHLKALVMFFGGRNILIIMLANFIV